jgi:DNA-binding NarL/FixJ family response regulator
MFEIPLNKYEKEERVIELHKQGKTIRQIAPIVHMSFRDISKIIKALLSKIDARVTIK